MANVEDLFNRLGDIESRLTTLHDDANDLKSAATKIDQSLTLGLNRIAQDLNAGFASLSQGFAQMLVQQQFTNRLLVQKVEQQGTMICQLEQIAKRTCDLVSEAHEQTRLQKNMRNDIERLLEIARTTHAAAALELQRFDAMKEEIEKCCPSEPTPPYCSHEPCPRPPEFRATPPGIDYKPYEPGIEPPH